MNILRSAPGHCVQLCWGHSFHPPDRDAPILATGSKQRSLSGEAQVRHAVTRMIASQGKNQHTKIRLGNSHTQEVITALQEGTHRLVW